MPLPFDNATAERLAEWIANLMRADLAARGARNVRRLTVGIAETEMQTAYHIIDLIS
jgi:hypothetical protein